MTTSDRDRRFLELALALQGLHSPDRVIAEFRDRVPDFARLDGVVWLWDPERGVLKAAGGQEWIPDSRGVTPHRGRRLGCHRGDRHDGPASV